MNEIQMVKWNVLLPPTISKRENFTYVFAYMQNRYELIKF